MCSAQNQQRNGVREQELLYNRYAKFVTTLFFLWSSHTYICFCKQLTTAFPVEQCIVCMHQWFASSRRHHLSFHRRRMRSKFRSIFFVCSICSKSLVTFKSLPHAKHNSVFVFFASFCLFLVDLFEHVCMCVCVVLCSFSIWKSHFLCILFCGTQIKSYLSFGSSLKHVFKQRPKPGYSNTTTTTHYCSWRKGNGTTIITPLKITISTQQYSPELCTRCMTLQLNISLSRGFICSVRFSDCLFYLISTFRIPWHCRVLFATHCCVISLWAFLFQIQFRSSNPVPMPSNRKQRRTMTTTR